MNDKLLQEYVERVGIVTTRELMEQTGIAGSLWRKPAASLVNRRELLLCRFDHGSPTILSRHLLLCLRAVYTEPTLQPDAQEVYDWLADNEQTGYKALRKGVRLAASDDFDGAFEELQRKLCVMPLVTSGNPLPPAASDRLLSDEVLEWVTDSYWLEGLHHPARYDDADYCASEVRRLLKGHFTLVEINALVYRGVL